jgi:triphosphoribosyl-dephospho-CoA synthase
MNADYIAQCGLLAMLLELSSSPKAGNVDRCHDHDDTRFQHFVASAVSSYPAFRKAASGEGSIGSLLLEAVRAWEGWQICGNTHFGSLVLLIPLAKSAGRNGPLERELCKLLNNTTVDDAVDFYSAFLLTGARVADVDELSLKDASSVDELKRRGHSLLDLMKLSQNHDLIAREWSSCFQRSFELSLIIRDKVSSYGINDGVVIAYFEALSKEPDSLVQAKFGLKKAIEVSQLAKSVLREDPGQTLLNARELDSLFIQEGINPGSTADLISAALFIALLNGMRF